MRETFSINHEYLRQLIDKTRVSRKNLADAIGISASSLNAYCTGRTDPMPETIIKLAYYFAVPVDVLLGRCSEEEFNDILKDYSSNFMKLRSQDYKAYFIDQKLDPENEIFTGSGSWKENFSSPWPNNLLDTIFKESIELLLDDKQMEGLETAIKSLSEREACYVYLYFREGFTLNEIGLKYNLTKERVRQILAAAIRKLRHPSRVQFIRYGIKGSEMQRELKALELEFEAKKSRLECLIESADKRARELDAWIKDKETAVENLNKTLIKTIDIDDLSVRSYNCLRRAGIDTIDDLISFVALGPNGGLPKVRNLGKASVTEILNYLKDKRNVDYFPLYKGYYLEKLH